MRKTFLAALLAGLLASTGAFAQALTQHVPAHLDGAQWVQGQSNGSTSCNTVSQTATQDTITITPPSGKTVVVQGLYVYNVTDATGVTQTGTIAIGGVGNAGTAANLSFGSALTTVQGVPAPQIITFGNGLMGTGQGTAVTFTPSATQSAHNYLCMFAWGTFQ